MATEFLLFAILLAIGAVGVSLLEPKRQAVPIKRRRH